MNDTLQLVVGYSLGIVIALLVRSWLQPDMSEFSTVLRRELNDYFNHCPL